MPSNPYSGWMQSSSEEDKIDPNSWHYYRWAGTDEWLAKYLKLRRDSPYTSDSDIEEARKSVLGYQKSLRATPQVETSEVIPLYDQQDELTPGEKIAKFMGVGLEAMGGNTFTKVADYIKPEPNETGLFSDVRRFSSDFLRSAGMSAYQTAADLAGSATDFFTGNTGKNQDYTLMGNAPQRYSDPGGAGQVLGSFADDVALAVATWGASAGALGGLSAASKAGKASGVAGRVGGWLAAGETPSAITLGGRYITPAATRLERVAASLAGAVPSAVSVAPQVVSGRMNVAEGALNVGLGALGGTLSAGQWGGKMLTNVLGDVAVNVGTQVAAEAVPAVIPGGAEFDAAQAWKNLAYGAVLGTGFGLMNAKPMQGAGDMSTFGARAAQEPAAGTVPVEQGAATTSGFKPKYVEIVQETERRLMGQAMLPDNATAEQANARLNEIRSMSAQDIATLKMDQEGNFASISDSYMGVEPENVGVKNAIDVERDIYANELASRYASNPELLISALDLEVRPGEITPESAQQVIAAKIKNEWLIQPVQGKGISGVEQRLSQAGIPGLSGEQAVAGPSVTVGEPGQPMLAPESTLPAPKLLEATQALGPVSPRAAIPETPEVQLPRTSFESAQMLQQNPPTQVAGLLPDAELGPFNAVLMPRAGGPMQAPESTLFARKIVDDADASLQEVKKVAEATNTPVESLVMPNSVESKLLEAESAGIPKEQAKQSVAAEVAESPETVNLWPGEQEILTPEAAPVKKRRPRKAREVVKDTKDASFLESLEGPATQSEADVEYKGQTARPGSDLADDDVNLLVDLVRSTNDDYFRAMTQWEQGRERALTEKKQTGKVGQRAQEIGRQTMRTEKNKLDMLEKMFGEEGLVANIYPPDKGGKYTVQETALASLEGVPPIAIRTAVASGQDKFFKGNVSVEPTGNPNEFVIRTRMSPEAKQRIATTYEYVAKEPATIQAKTEARALDRKSRIDKMNERLYADLEDVFAGETDRNALYATRGMEVPEGVETEFFTEIANYGESSSEAGLLEGSGFNQEAKQTEAAYADWRSKAKPILKSAVDYVAKGLKKAGYTAEDNVTNVDIKYYLISKIGPGRWRNVGELYVKNTMPASVRQILDDEFPALANPTRGGFTAIDRLIEHNGKIDDGWFNDRYDSYIPKFQEAMEAAEVIANKAGVQDPNDIVRFVRWDSQPGTAVDKQRFVESANLLSREPVQFDDIKAEAIREKINPLLAKDGDVYLAYDTLIQFNNNNRGAEAFQYILNENLMGNAKSYKVNLRNLPGLRIASVTAVMFALDGGVKTIEDDETYFGVPGSTLKKLLGNGEAGVYAVSTAGLFMSGIPARQKVGARQGMIAKTGNSLRKLVESRASRLNEPKMSMAKMTPAQRSEAADMFMAQNFPKINPNSPEYAKLKAEKLAAEDMAGLSGSTISQAFDRLRKDKTAGTISLMSKLVNDINLVGAKSQFVQEYVVKPYNETQAQIRRIVKGIEDPVNGVIADYIKTYKKDATFWDAFWALDYRMSDLELANEGLPRHIIRDAQQEVLSEIKAKYFTDSEGFVNENKWNDFNDFQEKLNPVRKEHLRALVSKSLGVNSWQIESHLAELITSKDRLDQLIGAAASGAETVKATIKQMDDTYAALREQNGADGVEKIMPGFAEARGNQARALRDHMRNLQKFEYERRKVTSRIDKINRLDEMIEKSMANRYMYRIRDNKAPLVVRVAFDPASGIASARREYYNFSDAKQGQIDIIRDAVSKLQATKPEYVEFVKQKTKITDRLEELDGMAELTPQQEAEYTKLSNDLDSMQGFKPVSEMSDAEVFRFANDYEQLGMQATIRDMRARVAVTRGTKAARELMDMVMSSSEVIEAQLLSRTLDSGALMKPGTQDVDFIKGKGNAALVDYGASGQVMVRQGDDAPSLDDLVESIDNLIDEPVDRVQLKELLETYYTFRDTGTNAKGQAVNTVWIDMGAIRRLVEAYTDPYVPNLIKRNNFTGYYDPDGTWTVAERADYTVKSIEGMLSQVQNYNQATAMRNAIQGATNWLEKWDIQNGLREYVGGLGVQTDRVLKGGWADVWSDYETSIRRGVSFATLMTNLGSNIGNRIQGFSMATAHGLQNATTKYGVYQTNADGTKGPVKWMPSEASARAELYKLQENGENNWSIAEGFTSKAYFDPKTYGFGIAAMVAPKKALEFLARRDGYGKLPLSQQGIWGVIYSQAEATNLQQGGVTGSYTVRQGIKTKTRGELLLQRMGALTDFVEESNNYSSILLSGLSIENKFGIRDADWQSMNTGQKTEAALTALAPYTKRFDEAAKARTYMDEEIQKLQARIDEAAADPMRDRERIMLEKQLESKIDRSQRLSTESSQFLDSLTEYLVFNRGFEQGNWDPMSKSKFERTLESVPGGRLALTMTAPILRSYNSWQAMFRTAGKTEGGKLATLGRLGGPLMGASILTVLLGGSANTAVGLGGVFFSDIAALAEMLYAYAVEEDGEKLDKVSSRQAWEDIAGDLAEKYGMEPADAKAFVRAAWPLGQSEGIIRQSWFPVIGNTNVNAGAGIWDITGGGTPAQVLLGVGKNISQAAERISEKWSAGSGTSYDYMYALSTAAPTSIKRLTQTGLQLLVPPSAGGFGAVKVDKFGQPVYDKDQNLQRLSGVDVFRNTFIGKPWSETRSKLVMYEGGTPLYTDDDRIAWANALARTKYVSFGVSSSQAMKGKGVAEQANAARFEADALQLQRAITNKYKEYRPAVDSAKNIINTMYKEDQPIDIGGGQMMSFRKILSIVASKGVKAEEEIKGSAPDEIRKNLLDLVEEWGRSHAAADAVQTYYGGTMLVSRTGDIKVPSGDVFALNKLGQQFGNAYRDYLLRTEGRRALGR